jgi:hypothetical protein
MESILLGAMLMSFRMGMFFRVLHFFVVLLTIEKIAKHNLSFPRRPE